MLSYKLTKILKIEGIVEISHFHEISDRKNILLQENATIIQTAYESYSVALPICYWLSTYSSMFTCRCARKSAWVAENGRKESLSCRIRLYNIIIFMIFSSLLYSCTLTFLPPMFFYYTFLQCLKILHIVYNETSPYK